MNPAHRQGAIQQPASATPVANYLSQPRPGLTVDGRYLVLPRIILENLPLPVQHQVATMLNTIHTLTTTPPVPARWPAGYRVNAVVWRPVGEMVEGELREVGVIAELDTEGELVHRDKSGKQLTHDELSRQAPVSSPDPLYGAITER